MGEDDEKVLTLVVVMVTQPWEYTKKTLKNLSTEYFKRTHPMSCALDLSRTVQEKEEASHLAQRLHHTQEPWWQETQCGADDLGPRGLLGPGTEPSCRAVAGP